MTIGWGGVCRGSTSSPPAAATPSATPTTATRACSPPTTSRSGSRPRPRAPTPWPGCSPSPSRCRRGPSARVTDLGRLRRARLRQAGPSRTSCPPSPRPSASATALPGGPPLDLVLPARRRTSCFLVDGLGAELLQRYAHAAPFLSSLADGQRPGTAGVPSTTATSLTSLGTGLPPGQPRAGRLHLAGARHRPAAQRAALGQARRPGRVAAAPDRLRPAHRSAACSVTAVNKREFAGSGLTIAAHRGATYVGADRVGERIAAVVAAARTRPSLTYVYDGDLDWTGHRSASARATGSSSSRWSTPRPSSCASRCRDGDPAAGGRRPRHGRQPRRRRGSTSTSTRCCATGWR